MRNVKMKVEKNILTITVDLDENFGRSKSGKTTIIASTDGNIQVPQSEARIGLNIYR